MARGCPSKQSFFGASPQRDNVIRLRQGYGGQVDEIRRTDALLEQAVMSGMTDEAERLREKLRKLTERI